MKPFQELVYKYDLGILLLPFQPEASRKSLIFSVAFWFYVKGFVFIKKFSESNSQEFFRVSVGRSLQAVTSSLFFFCILVNFTTIYGEYHIDL